MWCTCYSGRGTLLTRRTVLVAVARIRSRRGEPLLDLECVAADLVADYLAVSWADKLLPSSNPSLAHTNTQTHTRFLEPLARRLRCVMPAT